MKRILIAGLLSATTAGAAPGTVAGSKHDLSVGGPGPIKAVSETQVCIFCHVPHRTPGMSARPDPRASHVPYDSTTMRVRPGAPTGASRVCLSCHDGTIAVGETVRGNIQMNAAAPGGRIPASRRSNLGTDLRNTHPVSFAPGRDATIRVPPRGDAAHLDGAGQVQCTSCHDPHRESVDGLERHFLVKPTRNSALCITCHEVSALEGPSASHATATAPFGAAEGNEGGYRSVAEAGCRACHRSHLADPKGRLLDKRATEDDDALCLRCHGTPVTRRDIRRDVLKPYSHAAGRDVHDASEGPRSARRIPETSPSAQRHAACVDCHDPHAAEARDAVAPAAKGVLAGVWGIDQSGQRVDRVRFEYEVCFKCHGDSANQPQAYGAGGLDRVRRAVTDVNLRRVFDPSAPSFHPVVAPGRAPIVPSLKAPLTPSSLVYCSDCHASDTGAGAGGTGARGPHGSVYPHLLERSYQTADRTPEAQSAYALCYKCHDRDVLLSDRSSFRLHRRHVVDQQSPCSACHASHGVSLAAGTAVNNAHLIDFDVTIVGPDPRGLRQYTAGVLGSGSCTLTCHGSRHEARGY